MDEEAGTYLPLNTLKPIVENLWIVDGPTIRFGVPGLKFPFPTRMTVVRLSGGELFIHSPTPLGPELRQEICRTGTPRWIIGPNRLHYWWIPEWRAAFPSAQVYLAPRIKEQAAGRIDFATFPLIGCRERLSLGSRNSDASDCRELHDRSRILSSCKPHDDFDRSDREL